MRQYFSLALFLTLVLALFAVHPANGQSAVSGDRAATLEGSVVDVTEASIPGATLVLLPATGRPIAAETDALGAYVFRNLAPGEYRMQVTSVGFQPIELASLTLVAGLNRKDFAMAVFLTKQEVTVEADPVDSVSVDMASNASALVLKAEQLQALSDDPDALGNELQALAGPAAGPDGGAQVFVDGFSGGRIPPKSSIREVRINRDPYSAEFDRPGFGRIEILTKPGSDQFRGQTFLNFSDESLNSRNPFAVNRAPYQARNYGANLSGPISRKASFFLDFERREIDDNAVVNATMLDSLFQPVTLQQAYVTPQRRGTGTARIDYALNDKNTLVGRFNVLRTMSRNNGIGGFTLPERASDGRQNGETLQLTETATLSSNAINETRFEYSRMRNEQEPFTLAPAVNVLEAFQSGGATQGFASSGRNSLELQNMTSIVRGGHSIKLGGRLRGSDFTDVSPNNFLGSFTFAGGLAPALDAFNSPLTQADGSMLLTSVTSLERYRRTLYFQSLGYTPQQIGFLGGGASQFTLSAGLPEAAVRQYDLGLFFTHDWRVKPNLTLAFGLRYENQTNIRDNRNLAPRLSLAWSPDSKGGRNGKTVIRAGAGIFYDRFDESYTLSALRFNGANQQQFIVANPSFFPTVPTAADLTGNAVPQATYRVFDNLRVPYMIQSSLGVERSLPGSSTLSVNWVRTRAVNVLRTRNINAPLAGTGERPYGSENLFLYEATGRMEQQQMIANLSTRFHRRVMLFGFYSWGKAESDADRGNALPANQYDLSTEWGRSMMDIRHRVVIGGNVNAPWGISLNPFVMYRSGMPFNITTGRDNNGDTVFTDRPSFATDLSLPGVVQTAWGTFDPNPQPGMAMIPRNFGEGPSQFTVNLRLSRSWSFGERASGGSMPSMMGGGQGSPGEGGPGGGGPPPMMGGGGPMGGGGMRGGGARGGMGGFGGGSGRYSLNLSVSARNLFNTTNPGNPVGNLASPLFGQSTSLAGFGPMGGNAGNRILEASLRFTF